jgi:hypothetical protein
MNSFKLVNPLIIGQFNTEYTADNGLQAVSQFWNDLGSHITNNLPHTYVTLKDNNNNLSHYKISEKFNGGSKTADFTISEFNLNLSEKQKNKFLKKVSTFESKTTKTLEKQTGGVVKRKQSRTRKDDSSSSSSDSSSDDDYYNFSKYKRLSQPIAMWYYTPNLYGVRSVFLPTFNVPIVPYVKLWVPSFF